MERMNDLTMLDILANPKEWIKTGGTVNGYEFSQEVVLHELGDVLCELYYRESRNLP